MDKSLQVKDIEEIKVTLAALTRKQTVLEKCDSDVLELLTEGNDIAAEVAESSDYADMLTECITKLQLKVEHFDRKAAESLRQTDDSADQKPVVPVKSTESQIKLPKFQLKSYDGSLLTWSNFWDQFDAAVHTNSELSDIQKFTYLKSYLTGEADRSIQSLSLSKENYATAIETLTTRFGNKQARISAHMMELRSLKAVENIHDVVGLRKLYDTLELNINNLRQLNVDVATYGSLLISIIFENIPSELRIKISLEFKDQEWKLKETMDLLKEELEARERSVAIGGISASSASDDDQWDRNEFSTTSTFHLQSTPMGKQNQHRQYSHSDNQQSRYSNKKGNNKNNNNKQRYKANNRDNFTPKPPVGVVCVFCKQPHLSSRCRNVTNLNARFSIVTRENRCYICLKPNHCSRDCRLDYSCIKCQKRHNIALCDKNMLSRDGHQDAGPGSSGGVMHTEVYENVHDGAPRPAAVVAGDGMGRDNNVIVGLTDTTARNGVLLQCAKADVCSTNKERVVSTCIIFDNCSQRSFVTITLREQLSLPSIREDKIMLKTFGSKLATPQKLQVVRVGVKAADGRTIYLEACCVPYICSKFKIPNANWMKNKYVHLRDLELAAPPTEMSNIDILVGLDYYYSIVGGRVCRGFPGQPVAVESALGWIVCGPSQVPSSHQAEYEETVCNFVLTENNLEDDLKVQLQKFWEVESMPEDELEINDVVLKKFNEKIFHNGKRYVNSLPFKSDDEFVPDHYSLCFRRLLSLLQYFEKHPKRMEQYIDVFKAYERDGIIEKVFDSGDPGRVHYMPHRPVIREDKDTSKIRPVFDGSAKEKGGMSLNDHLYPGPSLLGRIFDIIIRFCFKEVALIADITQAFLNFEIAAEHKDYLRFLFVDFDDPGKIQAYRFNRGCFGVNCMPFLMSGTINYHMNSLKTNENIDLVPFIDQFLRDLYMDDVTTAVNNGDEGIQFYDFAKKAMKSAGLDLRKWESSLQKLREHMNCDGDILEKKVLGLTWSAEDEFVFDFVQLVNYALQQPLTKVTILSVGHRFYDPVGWIAPIIIIAKILFQAVCLCNLKWDDKLSDELADRWLKYLNQLLEIKCIRVPRYVFSGFPSVVNEVELHGFCDSSDQAYCAVTYIRAKSASVSCSRIIAAKTKVAPIKKISIPRLELLSCVLLTELMKNICISLKDVVNISKLYYWNDSEVALAWIKGVCKQWKPWVQNRVKKIRKETEVDCWRYVKTTENPADIGTREETALKLLSSDLWWYGPDFIRKETLIYEDIELNLDVEEELVFAMMVDSVKILGIGAIIEIERFSRLGTLLRVTAYVLRVIDICRSHRKTNEGVIPNRLKDVIDVDEMERALEYWVLYEQSVIRKNNNFKNLLKQLNLMEDNKNILRLRGRLEHSHLCYDTKHPMLLDRGSYFTKLVILDAHENVKHLRMKSTLNELRKRFWITSGRRTVSTTIKDCVTCTGVIGTSTVGPAPPDLPDYRISYEFAFSNIGIDYAGPLLVKDIYANSLLENPPVLHKCYICLLTCAATRNVHIELCPNMSVPALLRLLKRFMGRRGKFNLAISDNFKTFLSAELKQFLSKQGIRWSNILDKAPWWGAFYERLIRIIKETLKKCLGSAKLTYEELETALIEIEGVINCRPLTYLYEEVDEPLTPAHLVLGRRLNYNSIEQPATTESTSEQLNARFKYLQSLIDLYWKRFSHEYLTELHQHHINSSKHNYDTRCTLLLGDVVLIKDDSFKRNFWKRGRIETLIYGSDGKVRGALLKTTNGFIKRPIQKIIPLEVQKEQLKHCDVVDSERIVTEDAQLMEHCLDGSHASNSNTLTQDSPDSHSSHVVDISSRGRKRIPTKRYIESSS